MGLIKDIYCKWKNPFDTLLQKAKKSNHNRFLLVWNRGLGDIPLGLYALVYRIREIIPHASITFLTRKDLKDLFLLLEQVDVIEGGFKRGEKVDITKELGSRYDNYDVHLDGIDPTRWLSWQIGSLTPKLKWNANFDALIEKYDLDSGETYIGAHVNSETGEYYGYEKNWNHDKWRKLLQKIGAAKKGKVILFGMAKDDAFDMEHVIDLRGDTNVNEMLSLIKNRCQYLVAPDSGVLSCAYYIDAHFPIHLVSIWSDPRQGILRQGVVSPNEGCKHIPLIGEAGDVSTIGINQVYEALFDGS